jgi:hypothetical protein
VQLENSTWLASELLVADLPGAPRRIGILVAKASFRIEADGSTTPETEEPFPIFPSEHPTALGALPADVLPRGDAAFEVVLLGKAYAPWGRPTPSIQVSMTVGEVKREIAVFGDRYWMQGDGADGAPRISPPVPFTEMPLTWSRAFGGSAEVYIDVDSPVEVKDPTNPEGKGFDPSLQAAALGSALRAPEGFPWFDPVRPLPNLEDPRVPIARWEDQPPPVCWASVPISSAFHVARGMDLSAPPNPDAPVPLTDGFHHRAHPDWVLPLPPIHAPVVLEGMVPEWGLAFRIPALRVLADWAFGADSGTWEVAPQGMVLLPEERKFYLVYRHLFGVPKPSGGDRSLRLRTEPGWARPVQETR